MIQITENVFMLENETLLNSPEFKEMLQRLKPPRKHTWRHYCCLTAPGRKAEDDKFVTLFTEGSNRPSRVEFLGKTYFLTKYYTAGGWAIYYEHRQQA